MIYVVEEPFDVNVNHKIVVGNLDVSIDCCDCVLLAPIGAKPIAVVVEFFFTDWLQYYQPTQLDL